MMQSAPRGHVVDDGGVAAFGEELKRQREARGLALESVCEATKVPLRHIRALETGSYEELPGGVFRRGFVRSYVGVLGLEETDWMKRFEASCRVSGLRDLSGAEWAAFAENVKNSRGPSRRGARIRGMLLALLLVSVALAGWGGWRLKGHKRVLPTHVAWLTPRPVKAAPR